MPATAPEPKVTFVEADVILDIVLDETTGTPAPPLMSIPRKTADVELLFTEAFVIVFGKAAVPIIFVVPVDAARIPLKLPTPLATLKVLPDVALVRFPPTVVVRLPILRFGLVELPIVLPETVKFPAPTTLIPFIPPDTVAVVPIASMAPMLLF